MCRFTFTTRSYVNFRSLAKACHGKLYLLGFLLFLEQQGPQEYNSLTNNQERTTVPSIASVRQRVTVKCKNACRLNCARSLRKKRQAHIMSRAFPREIPDVTDTVTRLTIQVHSCTHPLSAFVYPQRKIEPNSINVTFPFPHTCCVLGQIGHTSSLTIF